MACDGLILGLLLVGCSIQALWAVSEDDPSEYMIREEREALKFVSLVVRLASKPTEVQLTDFLMKLYTFVEL